MAATGSLFPSMEGKLPVQVAAIQVANLIKQSENKLPAGLVDDLKSLVSANKTFLDQANIESKRKAGSEVPIDFDMHDRQDKLEDKVNAEDQSAAAARLLYEQKKQALQVNFDSLNRKIQEAKEEQDEDRFRQLVLDNKHNLDVAQQFDETERMMNASSRCWRFFHCCAPTQYLELKTQFEQRREQFAKLLKDKETTRGLVVASIIKDRDAANAALQLHLSNAPALQPESKASKKLAKLDGRIALAEEYNADDLKQDTLIAFLRVYENLVRLNDKLEPPPDETTPLVPKAASILDLVRGNIVSVIRNLTSKLNDFFCSELSSLTAAHFHRAFFDALSLAEQGDFIAGKESADVRNKLLISGYCIPSHSVSISATH